MKPAYLPDRLNYPRRWHELPLGECIRRETEQVLQQQCRQFFGYHMVMLGDLSCQLDLSECAIKHKVLQTNKSAEYGGLLSMSESLPYQKNAIDAFVLAHELDFAHDPHQILREVNRAIIPNGHVVISGFNPLSLAGLTRFLPLERNKTLRQARFFTASRIKDWLQLLGFEIISDKRTVHNALLFEGMTQQDNKWQRFKRDYLSFSGSVYVITARKRESTLTMIKPKWRHSPKFSTVGASAQAWHRNR
ncbi:methyltransferase domain-containing protein [Alteromonadaceae bacterium BrNp21-10]|nr:methyltransferase domain-containing protein [Alteromonadaceae bacterium BrNp21-10]